MIAKICFVVTACSCLMMPEAHAYIDPGSGSMLLQAIAACGIAVLVFGKSIINRVRGLMGGGRAEEAPEDGDSKAE